MCCNVCSTNLSLFGVPKILTFSWGRRRQSRNQRAHVQEESKLRYCARATNVRFFTRNTLSRFLTLKHMLATGTQRELEKCTLCSIDQTTAMLCSSGSKALTIIICLMRSLISHKGSESSRIATFPPSCRLDSLTFLNSRSRSHNLRFVNISLDEVFDFT